MKVTLDLQAIDCGVPAHVAQPGSFKYGSSQRIMDCIEINTYMPVQISTRIDTAI